MIPAEAQKILDGSLERAERMRNASRRVTCYWDGVIDALLRAKELSQPPVSSETLKEGR